MLIKRVAIFEKKNRPKMNLEEIIEEEFVRDHIKRKLSYQALSERLQALYPGTVLCKSNASEMREFHSLFP